jgi:hypothetical protein
MKRHPLLVPVFVFVLLVLTVFSRVAGVTDAAVQEAGTGVPTSNLVVTVSESNVSKLTGESFTFTSTITNNGPQTTPPLIANLNFTSLDNSAYIDPEDWSPQRTMSVDPLDPGTSVTKTWKVNPILEGEVAAYIVILPKSDTLTTQPLTTSPAIHMHVGAQRSLNPGGVLPVTLAVPGILAASFVGLRITRNKRRA